MFYSISETFSSRSTTKKLNIFNMIFFHYKWFKKNHHDQLDLVIRFKRIKEILKRVDVILNPCQKSRYKPYNTVNKLFLWVISSCRPAQCELFCLSDDTFDNTLASVINCTIDDVNSKRSLLCMHDNLCR